MNKPVLIVLAVSIGAAILIGALVWTFGLKPLQSNPITAKTTPAEEQTPEIRPANNDTVYFVGSPVSGTIEKRIPLLPEYSNGSVTALVDSISIAGLKQSTNILFYKKNSLAYSQTGKITASTSVVDMPDKTRLTLSVDDVVLNDKPEKAALILSKNPLAKRLPLSAVITDSETKQNYIWIVNLNTEKPSEGTVQRLDVTIRDQDESFFDINRYMRITQLAVLNPDDDLRDEQVIQVRMQPIKAPQTNDRIEAIYQEANDGKFCEPRAKSSGSSCTPSSQQ